MKGGEIHIPGLGGGANNHPNKFISVNGVMRDDSFDLGSKSTAFFVLILSSHLFYLQHQEVIDQVMAPIILNLRAHSKLLLVSHDYRQSITVSIASNLNITAILTGAASSAQGKQHLMDTGAKVTGISSGHET